MASDYGGRGCRTSIVGHVEHVDAGLDLEQLAREVTRVADAGARERERAGLSFRKRDELFYRPRRHRRIDRQYVRAAYDKRHWSEILVRSIRQRCSEK